MDASHVDTEINLLKEKIVELGTRNEDGTHSIAFGKLYTETVDIFEVFTSFLPMIHLYSIHRH